MTRCSSYFDGKKTHDFVGDECRNCGYSRAEDVNDDWACFARVMRLRNFRIDEPMTADGAYVSWVFFGAKGDIKAWTRAVCFRERDAILEVSMLLGKNIFGEDRP